MHRLPPGLRGRFPEISTPRGGSTIANKAWLVTPKPAPSMNRVTPVVMLSKARLRWAYTGSSLRGRSSEASSSNPANSPKANPATTSNAVAAGSPNAPHATDGRISRADATNAQRTGGRPLVGRRPAEARASPNNRVRIASNRTPAARRATAACAAAPNCSSSRGANLANPARTMNPAPIAQVRNTGRRLERTKIKRGRRAREISKACPHDTSSQVTPGKGAVESTRSCSISQATPCVRRVTARTHAAVTSRSASAPQPEAFAWVAATAASGASGCKGGSGSLLWLRLIRDSLAESNRCCKEGWQTTGRESSPRNNLT